MASETNVYLMLLADHASHLSLKSLFTDGVLHSEGVETLTTHVMTEDGRKCFVHIHTYDPQTTAHRVPESDGFIFLLKNQESLQYCHDTVKGIADAHLKEHAKYDILLSHVFAVAIHDCLLKE